VVTYEHWQHANIGPAREPPLVTTFTASTSRTKASIELQANKETENTTLETLTNKEYRTVGFSICHGSDIKRRVRNRLGMCSETFTYTIAYADNIVIPPKSILPSHSSSHLSNTLPFYHKLTVAEANELPRLSGHPEFT
jgi:hypothetical protein